MASWTARRLYPYEFEETPNGASPARPIPPVIVFAVVRYEPKDFGQRRRDGQRGYVWNLDGVTPRLYHLNDLAGRERVIIAEGERDVDGPLTLNLPATCNAGGAGQWRSTRTEQL